LPALKTYEISVMWQYERAPASYLERRFALFPDGGARLHRERGGRAQLRTARLTPLRCNGDAVAAVDQALGLVHRTWSGAGETVVVTRTDTPMWHVGRQLEASWPGSQQKRQGAEFPHRGHSVPTETT
jgi:hypothetical protein